MNAVQTIDLTKKYGSLVAVNHLNLQIPQGELFALLGVNGAGKTTTIKMLCGLTKPTSGSAQIGGYSLSEDSAGIRKIIGVSPQETAVAPNLTVKENLELMGALHGFSKDKTRRKLQELSACLNLQHVMERKAGKLSGGWQRRVSIAMALIGDPSILFLDEPTLGLDVMARRELWSLIRSLKKTATIILTTHYMEEAEALSDRIGIMKDGELIAIGTAQELMDRTSTDTFEDAFISLVKEGQS